MLTALARLLSELVRLTVIVALSVTAGLAVALATRNVEGDVLEILAFFATFATPVIVAWLLFRTLPPFSRRPTDSPVARVLDNGKDSQDANNEQPQNRAARDHLR